MGKCLKSLQPPSLLLKDDNTALYSPESYFNTLFYQELPLFCVAGRWGWEVG